MNPALAVLPLLSALLLSGCALRQPTGEDVARSERRAYVVCAVRQAYSVPYVRNARAAHGLALAAMAACSDQRDAVHAQLLAAHRFHAQGEDRARAILAEIDAALYVQLATRLHQSASMQRALNAAGTPI